MKLSAMTPPQRRARGGGLRGVGLLLAGLEKHEIDQAQRLQGRDFGQIMDRMKSWFKQNF